MGRDPLLNIHIAGLEKMLDFLPYPFLISEFKDGTYHNLYLNQKFIQEIGYSIIDIPTIDDWFIKAYPDEKHRKEIITSWTTRYHRSKIEGKDFTLMKVLIHTKTNGDRWYEIKASLIWPIQLVAFVDINKEIKREKELEKLNNTNTTTLSILSHDLRSPLINLNSLTEMVLHNKLSQEEFIHLIKKLSEKSQQVLDLLDTTLLWTKSNFDRVTVRLEDVDLHQLVQKTLSLYEHSYESKRLKIKLLLDNHHPVTDSEIITIVIRNLISNAIKFTPDGGAITIASTKTKKGFSITVSDSGVGMSSEVLMQLQEGHYSSEQGTRHEKGHGIGLRLCRELLDRVNSKMEIESKLNEGTTVTILL